MECLERIMNERLPKQYTLLYKLYGVEYSVVYSVFNDAARLYNAGLQSE